MRYNSSLKDLNSDPNRSSSPRMPSLAEKLTHIPIPLNADFFNGLLET
jgi:hypothetical protein